MRKLITLALILVCIAAAKSQDTKKVFSTKEIVWYGLDFTKAKFVGFDQTGATASDLRNKMMPAWNALILNEQPKFDLRKSFRKDDVFFDLTSVNNLNSKIDVDSYIAYNPGTIEKSSINGMVQKYSGEKKEGLGLVFIIENFNKTTQMADVYVTFFDIATKKVLLCEKVSGKAVGIGVRNYWAGGIKSILKKIDEDEYKNWKSKY